MYDVEHEYCSCCVAVGMWMLSAVSPWYSAQCHSNVFILRE
jgi:hypothetical protein